VKATTILRAYVAAHTEWAEAQQRSARALVESVMGRKVDASPHIRLMDRRNGLLDRCENRLERICREHDGFTDGSWGILPRTRLP
jgi:hypothetical protein